jgi:hypothetical protein
MLFLIILDFIFTVFVYMPVRYRYMELLEETISEQQQQQQEQQQQQQEPIVNDPSDVFAYADDLPRQQQQQQQQQQRRSKPQPQQQQNVTVNTTPSNAPVRSSLHAHQQRQQHLQRAAAEIKGANSKLGVQPLYTYKQRSK